MNLTKKLVVAGSALAVTAAGVGMGVAYAAPTASPSPSVSSAPSAAPKADRKHHRKDLAKRALHGEFTLANKTHTVVDVQRGTVSAVTGPKVSVASGDGFKQDYLVDAKTKIVLVSGTKADRKRTPAQLKDVTTDVKVSVVATRSGETRTAKRIVVRAG